jgi:chemotaxis regulatin CheY-phosphate phosphatase CheZ
MTKYTVTIDTTKNTKLFLDMMQSMKFVKNVEEEKPVSDKLSAAEIKLLESRWNDYLKNPDDVQTWKQVKAELTKKYAR